MSKTKRGRPPLAEPARTLIRVDRETHRRLREIAGREGLLFGGSPSAPAAVRWLVSRHTDSGVTRSGKSREAGEAPAQHADDYV